jgi:anaerobic magnesium-protoporphyrin IX monomethyl ester cyclase
MRMILINPGISHKKEVYLEEKFDFPTESMALSILAGILTKENIPSAILDAYACRWKWKTTLLKILTMIKKDDVVGFSLLESSAENAKKIIQGFRNAGCKNIIILGGWLATAGPYHLLEYIKEADIVISGEADRTLPELLHSIKKRQPYENRDGLVFHNSKNKIHYRTESKKTIDLDLLPLPYHYILNDSSCKVKHSPLPIESSRGCSWGRCTFCSTAGRYPDKNWRFRSPEKIVEELIKVYHDTGVNRFCFVDDEFFGPCKEGFQRARDFVNILSRAKLPVKFSIDCRINDIRRDLFKGLKSVGLYNVFLGIESGNNDSLKTFDKGFTVEKIASKLAVLDDLEIKYQTGFITFEPYLTPNSLYENVTFLYNTLKHNGNPGKSLIKLKPNFGTPIWHRLKEEGLLLGDYPSWDFNFKHPDVQKIYEELTKKTEPLIDTYFKEELYGEKTERKIARSKELNEGFFRIFHTVFTTIVKKNPLLQFNCF